MVASKSWSMVFDGCLISGLSMVYGRYKEVVHGCLKGLWQLTTWCRNSNVSFHPSSFHTSSNSSHIYGGYHPRWKFLWEHDGTWRLLPADRRPTVGSAVAWLQRMVAGMMWWIDINSVYRSFPPFPTQHLRNSRSFILFRTVTHPFKLFKITPCKRAAPVAPSGPKAHPKVCSVQRVGWITWPPEKHTFWTGVFLILSFFGSAINCYIQIYYS